MQICIELHFEFGHECGFEAVCAPVVLQEKVRTSPDQRGGIQKRRSTRARTGSAAVWD